MTGANILVHGGLTAKYREPAGGPGIPGPAFDLPAA